MKNSEKKEHPSTYFVQDRDNQRELARLTIQDQMLTNSMGGPLPEQPDPALFRRVLDVGCGAGGWIIELAKTYPTMSLFGVDVSKSMVEYAREQAVAEHVEDHIELHVMDALRMLEFPAGFFDLVNLRCALGFLRTWDWPRIIGELLRVTRPGGVVRVTDAEITHISSSHAFVQFAELFQHALFQAGNLFEQTPTGLTDQLAPLLKQHGCNMVQTKVYPLTYRAGTPEGDAYIEDMKHAFSTLRPFIHKWHPDGKNLDYDAICKQALDEMQQSNFYATWNLLTAWGTK